MIRTVMELIDNTFRAADGDVGDVHDLYFDDASWTIRYFVVDVHRWLPGLSLLLPPRSITRHDRTARVMHTDLSKEEMEETPTAFEDNAVGRQRTDGLFDHEGWKPYWLGTTSALEATASIAPLRSHVTDAEAGGRDDDPHNGPNLRSVKKVRGYRVECSDAKVGEVVDFAYDDETWHVRYVVVETQRFSPHRRVLIAPSWTQRIDWTDRAITLDLTCDEVERAPSLEPGEEVDTAYEETLRAHFGMPSKGGSSSEGRT